MKGGDTFEERAVRFRQPAAHYAMVVGPDGRFLGADEDGATHVTDTISDDLMWHRRRDRLEHAKSSAALDLTETEAGGCRLTCDGTPLDAHGHRESPGAPFSIVQGSELLPSEYLAHLKAHGWTCLAAILSPDIIDSLQRIACTDGYAERTPDRSRRQICQGSALAKTAVEPISVWLARQYMQTEDIRLAHSPGIGVMTPDDGQRTVQGWHSDYPYHWGINADGKVPTPSGETVMGVQRIVCVSEFTKHRGATAFKLGSHALDRGPPEHWGVARAVYQPDYRAANGLPYNGPDADVIEAPPGSMILFDTRTWHRAGVNRSDREPRRDPDGHDAGVHRALFGHHGGLPGLGGERSPRRTQRARTTGVPTLDDPPVSRTRRTAFRHRDRPGTDGTHPASQVPATTVE